ncbi:hypothetical protein ACQCWA_17780 [Rossellomorea aquimaris]|uniref:hypothetical protein n=1 Tax=Rossellomorea aquimaris TaxID=189382 RepID=UPI003CE78D97
MELTLNGQAVVVRDYQEDDYVDILRLNIDEKWNNLVENVENVKQFWNHSSIPYVNKKLHKTPFIVRFL